MIRNIYPLLRPLLFALPPEKAHSLTVAALKTGLLRLAPCLNAQDAQSLQTDIEGLHFANPLGMAAGFDKNADIVDETLQLGFGFTEIGTVTPRPQLGNPRPRLFRLAADEAVINRMGFNNAGHEAVYQKLAARQARMAEQAKTDKAAARKECGKCAPHSGRLGVNIGANKDSDDKIADYVAGLVRFWPLAEYFAVNISSPNTPGLRALQGAENLRRLAAAVAAARADLTARYGYARPVFLKIAPDLTERELDGIAAEFLAQPFSGLIISNTTIGRPKTLRDKRQAAQTGGLSGKPLFALSTVALAKMRQRLGKSVPLIGVGGVRDSQTALAKIEAGADMVQLYSGLVYQGAYAVPAIIKGLTGACRARGVAHISALRDTKTAEWASRPLSL